MSRPAEREQNWYPISKLGWFTSHIREGVAVTLRQLELLQPGPPSGVTLTWTDNATAPAATLVRVERASYPGFTVGVTDVTAAGSHLLHRTAVAEGATYY